MGFAKDLLQAIREAPAAIRKYAKCDHEFEFIGRTVDPNGFTYSREQCTKCGCARVTTDKPPRRY